MTDPTRRAAGEFMRAALATRQEQIDAAVIAALTEAIRARKEWDEGPGLYFIEKLDGKYTVRDRSIFDQWPPNPTFALEPLADMVEEADFLRKVFVGDPRNPFVGIAFRCECWTVTADPDRMEELSAVQHKRQLHRHPERVEQRLIWAVTQGGRQYMASQTRGSDEIASHAVDQAEGMVPESLARLVAALLPQVTRPYEGGKDAEGS